MSYNYCKDHRSGITYVYEMEKSLDALSGKIVSKRKLVGKLDEEGNVVPTSGRRGRLPKKQEAVPENEEQFMETITSLKSEVEELKSTVSKLRKENLFLINSLEGILSQVRH